MDKFTGPAAMAARKAADMAADRASRAYASMHARIAESNASLKESEEARAAAEAELAKANAALKEANRTIEHLKQRIAETTAVLPEIAAPKKRKEAKQVEGNEEK